MGDWLTRWTTDTRSRNRIRAARMRHIARPNKMSHVKAPISPKILPRDHSPFIIFSGLMICGLICSGKVALSHYNESLQASYFKRKTTHLAQHATPQTPAHIRCFKLLSTTKILSKTLRRNPRRLREQNELLRHRDNGIAMEPTCHCAYSESQSDITAKNTITPPIQTGASLHPTQQCQEISFNSRAECMQREPA